MLYRRGVGIMLLNHEKKIFTGLRRDISNVWQMPQGGIQKSDEDETAAMFRELHEETGLSFEAVEIAAINKNYLKYDFPTSISTKLWRGNFAGQKQRWFLLNFVGDEGQIDINIGSRPEFKDWRWQSQEELLENVVDFKKNLYENIFTSFARYL